MSEALKGIECMIQHLGDAKCLTRVEKDEGVRKLLFMGKWDRGFLGALAKGVNILPTNYESHKWGRWKAMCLGSKKVECSLWQSHMQTTLRDPSSCHANSLR